MGVAVQMSGGTLVALIGGVSCALVFVLVIAVVAAHSRLTRLQAQADRAWSQIDAQLSRRYVLAPVLVERVRRHAVFDRHASDEVAAARSVAMAAATHAAGPAGRAAAEERLSRAVGRLTAIGEAYPELRSDPGFGALQVELATIEDKIAYGGRSFNETVASYNAAVRRLPTAIVASVAGFRPRNPFAAAPDQPSVTSRATSAAQPQDSVIPAPPWP